MESYLKGNDMGYGSDSSAEAQGDAATAGIEAGLINFMLISAHTAIPELDLQAAYLDDPASFIKEHLQDVAYSDLNSADVSLLVDLNDDSDAIFGEIAASAADDGSEVFHFANPMENYHVNAFLNVGVQHDQLDLAPLLDSLGAPQDAEVRGAMVNLEQVNGDVLLTVDGAPDFSVTFIDAASNQLQDFSIGSDILI